LRDVPTILGRHHSFVRANLVVLPVELLCLASRCSQKAENHNRRFSRRPSLRLRTESSDNAKLVAAADPLLGRRSYCLTIRRLAISL
jgi:hypothetical protein